jgi:hypothetical protein
MNHPRRNRVHRDGGDLPWLVSERNAAVATATIGLGYDEEELRRYVAPLWPPN